ncbi:hypothetical protein D9756_007913 [Leucocoprinus leucothites]|uniref:Uncharacterized protein n=1 Tax=Leucocoprinus leucothites TaxID=201217 RepID=A0A8H5FYC2_9AGAR|nr:hypothetical protein D9756_007913 [Leucoagaricus leucothites]
MTIIGGEIVGGDIINETIIGATIIGTGGGGPEHHGVNPTLRGPGRITRSETPSPPSSTIQTTTPISFPPSPSNTDIFTSTSSTSQSLTSSRSFTTLYSQVNSISPSVNTLSSQSSTSAASTTSTHTSNLSNSKPDARILAPVCIVLAVILIAAIIYFRRFCKSKSPSRAGSSTKTIVYPFYGRVPERPVPGVIAQRDPPRIPRAKVDHRSGLPRQPQTSRIIQTEQNNADTPPPPREPHVESESRIFVTVLSRIQETLEAMVASRGSTGPANAHGQRQDNVVDLDDRPPEYDSQPDLGGSREQVLRGDGEKRRSL